MSIHPTAVVAPGAQIDETTEVGPYCVIGEHVKIGPNNKLVAYVYIDGYVEIGKGNRFYPNCSIGTPPQDVGWREDMVTYVKIGDENIIRENVTIHSGTLGSDENATTTVGSHNYLMANTHIAHDCTVGDYVIMVSFSGCPGHTQLFDHCIISGLSGMHQFCRIGRYAMMSGNTVINKDLPPFMIADGRNGSVRAINVVGMRRAGFSAETIRAMHEVHKIFYTEGHTMSVAIEEIKKRVPQTPEVLEFVEFVETPSKRGILFGQLGRRD